MEFQLARPALQLDESGGDRAGVEVCRPFTTDRHVVLPATIILPPRSRAVAVEVANPA